MFVASAVICIRRKTRLSNKKNFALALYFMGEFLLCSERLGFVDARAIGSVGQVRMVIILLLWS